jgi:hypothetical protein
VIRFWRGLDGHEKALAVCLVVFVLAFIVKIVAIFMGARV